MVERLVALKEPRMALSWAVSRALLRVETKADRKADALAAPRVVTWVCSSGLQGGASNLHLSQNPIRKNLENHLICVRGARGNVHHTYLPIGWRVGWRVG